MVGLDVLLSASIGAGLSLLAKVGFEKEAEDLKARLLGSDEKARKRAFDNAFDIAAKKISDKTLKPLLNHRPFRESVITGLLDPLEGFDLKAAGEVSMTLQFPVFPFVWGVAAGCGMLTVVLLMRAFGALLRLTTKQA